MENNPTTPATPTPTEVKNTPKQTARKKPGAKTILIIVLLCLLVLLPLIVYLVKEHQISALKKQATEMMMKNTEENLQNVTRVFTWAVRAQVLSERYEDLRNIMSELVQTPGFNNIKMITPDARVKYSTDKKDEGSLYPSAFFIKIKGLEKIQLNRLENDQLEVVAPVYGIDRILGHVIVNYTATRPDFDKNTPSEKE